LTQLDYSLVSDAATLILAETRAVDGRPRHKINWAGRPTKHAITSWHHQDVTVDQPELKPPTLTDGVIQLRMHEPEDIPGIIAQATDPESIKWTTVPLPYGVTDAEEWALKAIPTGWANHTSYAFAIVDLADGSFCGSVDVRPQEPGAAEVGYGLAPAARGRGIMTRALRLAVDWAFAAPADDGLGLQVLRWKAHVGNFASRRVAWRLGFRVEGTVRRLCAQRGQLRDAWIGTLLPEDPREPNTPWLDTPTLHGNDVLLRPWRDSDAASIVAAATDPTSRHWLGTLPEPYGEDTALRFIRESECHHADGTGLYLAAATSDDGPAIGSFSLMGGSTAFDTAEVGYWVHPGWRGRGVATEAVRLLVRHSFIPLEDGGLGLRRLTLYAATDNIASQRVAEKVGFVYGGTQRAATRLGDGRYADLAAYDLLPTDVS
jgi:ribosomal-protein-alanine N-acetyltransferase